LTKHSGFRVARDSKVRVGPLSGQSDILGLIGFELRAQECFFEKRLETDAGLTVCEKIRLHLLQELGHRNAILLAKNFCDDLFNRSLAGGFSIQLVLLLTLFHYLAWPA
jgi:hypothetical protein